MQIWLARHARPLIAPGMCYGALDIAADADATALAAAQLAAVLPHAIAVHYSPALRCRQLADAVHAARPDLAMLCAPDLREMDFGHWEGQRWDTIAPSELAAWTDDFENYVCGGNGECTGDFVWRVLRYLQQCDQHTQSLEPGDAKNHDVHAVLPAIGWITHAGVMRATAWLMQQVGPEMAGLPETPASPPRRLGLRADAWPLHAPHFGQYQLLDWTARVPPPHC